MVKVAFNAALAQKDAAKKEEEEDGGEGSESRGEKGNSGCSSSSHVLILPPGAKDSEVVPIGQRRAWCWCMCFGLAFMLAVVILGGAYLYKYFAFQESGVYFCGIKYIEDGLSLTDSKGEVSAPRYQIIEENIQILQKEDVEFISVPVPEFADSDPADIVHDFHRRLTAYLDLNLDKCYVIPLNMSIVMPPKNFLELLINIKAGTYLPQSYLIHEQMIVTDRIENVDQLGFFIYRLCHGKDTYKLQRKETLKGIQKREANNCRIIRHFENRFAVETIICEE
nr:integral membrane protein 2B [Pogona vitticeps]